MVELHIGNSRSQIIGANISQHKELKKIMSYKIDAQAAYFSGASWNPVRYLIDKKGFFPTGLLSRLSAWIRDNKVEIKDSRRFPPGMNLFSLSLGFGPYPEQVEAAKRAHFFRRGIVSMPTGTGKTVAIALAISYLQVKTLIVVPTLELKKQLTDCFRQYFGAKNVGFKEKIWVENVDALEIDEHYYSGYDAVIIDEFHHSAATTYRKLNEKAWNNIYYRLGFTATAFRTNDNEQILLESVLSETICSLSYNVAVEKGYIVPVEAYYLEIPKTKTEGSRYAKVYSDLVVNNTIRNNMIGVLLGRLKGHSTLCLVKEVKHGEILSDLTGIPFANGQDEDSRTYIEKFASGKIKALIATEGVCGEGIDTKPCEYVVIAGLGKAKGALMQKIGRCVRKYPGKESGKVFIFKDDSHKFTLRHFKQQTLVIKEEYGTTPIKLDLDALL